MEGYGLLTIGRDQILGNCCIESVRVLECLGHEHKKCWKQQDHIEPDKAKETLSLAMCGRAAGWEQVCSLSVGSQ